MLPQVQIDGLIRVDKISQDLFAASVRCKAAALRDIDGLTSTRLEANPCKFVPGANRTMIQEDGIDGVDDSFGKNVTLEQIWGGGCSGFCVRGWL